MLRSERRDLSRVERSRADCGYYAPPPIMHTINDCFSFRSLSESTLTLVNRIAFAQSKGFSTGTEGETYWDYGLKVQKCVGELTKQLTDQTFQWSPAREMVRVLKSGKSRRIYVSNWSDRLVEHWLNDCLTGLLDKWYSPRCLSYRHGGMYGHTACHKKVRTALERWENPYVYKTDITSYFYQIDHEWMLRQLGELFEGYLLRLLTDKIRYSFIPEDGSNTAKSSLGIPFGSALACVLSNIHLTDVDKMFDNRSPDLEYFRYADDILLLSPDADVYEAAVKDFEQAIADRHLELSDRKTQASKLGVDAKSFTHLGLEWRVGGESRLSLPKFRKLRNLFRRSLSNSASRIRKQKTLQGKVEMAAKIVSSAIHERIKNAAIVDYYLQHVSDEEQIHKLDRLLMEAVVSVVLNKRFRQRDFKLVSPEMMRKAGVPSLLHRHRLHKHGHLHVDLLSVRNEDMLERYMDKHEARAETLNFMRMKKAQNKVKKNDPKDSVRS